MWAHSKEIQQSGFHTLLAGGEQSVEQGSGSMRSCQGSLGLTMQLQGWHLASLVWFLTGDKGSCQLCLSKPLGQVMGAGVHSRKQEDKQDTHWVSLAANPGSGVPPILPS